MPGQSVGGVVQDAKQGMQVLDVGALEELQAAELDERDVTSGQFEFEVVGMRPGSVEHRLVPEVHPSLTGVEDGVADST